MGGWPGLAASEDAGLGRDVEGAGTEPLQQLGDEPVGVVVRTTDVKCEGVQLWAVGNIDLDVRAPDPDVAPGRVGEVCRRTNLDPDPSRYRLGARRVARPTIQPAKMP